VTKKPQTFTKSVIPVLKESLLIGGGLGVILPLYFHFFGSEDRFAALALWSIFGVLLLPALYTLKFFALGRPAITLSSKGIVLHSYFARKHKFIWSEFNQAQLKKHRLRLIKKTKGKVTLREDGFSSDAWQRICKLVFSQYDVDHKSNEIEPSFKPEYESTLLISFLGVGFMVACGWILQLGALADFTEHPEIFLAFISMTIVFLAFPSLLVKRIRFADKIIIERFAMPPKKISYESVLGVTVRALHTQDGNISISSMKNAHSLFDILEQKREDGSLKEDQLRGQGAVHEAIAIKALMISLPLTIFAIFVFTYIKMQWTFLSARASYLILFALLYLATFFLLRRRSRAVEHEIIPF